jgi:hypothetical protein
VTIKAAVQDPASAPDDADPAGIPIVPESLADEAFAEGLAAAEDPVGAARDAGNASGGWNVEREADPLNEIRRGVLEYLVLIDRPADEDPADPVVPPAAPTVVPPAPSPVAAADRPSDAPAAPVADPMAPDPMPLDADPVGNSSMPEAAAPKIGASPDEVPALSPVVEASMDADEAPTPVKGNPAARFRDRTRPAKSMIITRSTRTEKTRTTLISRPIGDPWRSNE